MNLGGGYRKPSGIAGALARNSRQGAAPTARAPVAQVGVSPINRTMPAKILNTVGVGTPRKAANATFRSAPAYRPGVGSIPLQQQEQAPAPINAGQVAAGTAPAIYQQQPMQGAMAHLPTSGDINLAAQILPQQHLPMQPVQQPAHQLIPQLRNLIVQALAGQRPAGMGGRLI